MKHSKRHTDSAEGDLAHIQQLRPEPAPGGGGPRPVGPAGPADFSAPAGYSVAAGPAGAADPAATPTGRAGGDPTAGAGDYGHPRYSEVDPESVPRAPAGLSVPVASDQPPGAVIGPGGPRVDLPVPPAMQYPPGAPLGPLPGQHRPEPGSWAPAGGLPGAPGPGYPDPAMSGATAVIATPWTDDAAGAKEWITCPECGESAAIEPAQRRSEDFCQRCDFPLFWARNAVIAMSMDETGASLRRLPGTVGRAATASVACPHCGEPNSPTAIICIRCSLPMVVEQPEPEPEPEPVYVPPPPEPEPEPGFPWGWVIAACVVLVLITVLVAWIALL